MNICFAYITPYHPERGGIGRVTHSLTLELQKRGYNVFYLIFCVNMTIKHEFDYPAPLTYIYSDNVDEYLSQSVISEYHRFLNEKHIDIVINQSGNFDDSKLWLNTGNSNIKVISVLHSNPWVAYKHLWSSDIYPLKNDSIKEKVKRIARCLLYPKIKFDYARKRKEHFEFLLPRTDIVCLLSEKYYRELSKIVPGYEYKYRAIPNPNSYSDEDLRKTEVVKKNKILFVGLFGAQKREDRLVSLWEKIYRYYPDWELVIVGDGPKLRVDRLKNISKNIPNIRFEGFKSPLKYQQQAKICCMTSNYEGWGMVLTEAMQCGTVPIAFNSFASVTDIIDDGRNGYLVKPFDMKEYETKLRFLMDNTKILSQMSIHAKKDIKKYSAENIVDKWEELFRSLNIMV